MCGDAGLLVLDALLTKGEIGLWDTPDRFVRAGESARILVSSILFATLTLRNRSSNCVRSFADIFPTKDHILSPIKAYPSLCARMFESHR